MDLWHFVPGVLLGRGQRIAHEPQVRHCVPMGWQGAGTLGVCCHLVCFQDACCKPGLIRPLGGLCPSAFQDGHLQTLWQPLALRTLTCSADALFSKWLSKHSLGQAFLDLLDSLKGI